MLGVVWVLDFDATMPVTRFGGVGKELLREYDASFFKPFEKTPGVFFLMLLLLTMLIRNTGINYYQDHSIMHTGLAMSTTKTPMMTVMTMMTVITQSSVRVEPSPTDVQL